jgi:hypothetical protein
VDSGLSLMLFCVILIFAFAIVLSSCVFLIVAGFLHFPFFRTGLSFTIPLANDLNAVPVVLGGVCVFGQTSEQKISCVLSIRRSLQLAMLLLFCLASLIGLASAKAWQSRIETGTPVTFVVLSWILALAGLLTSLFWYFECSLLAKSRPVIGRILDTSGHRSKVPYDFPDQTGTVLSGWFLKRKRDGDNGVVVFYDPSNPKRNITHNSLRFHSLVVLRRPLS